MLYCNSTKDHVTVFHISDQIRLIHILKQTESSF